MGVHVYYKQTGANTFGNRMVFSLSKYHDNDGVKSQKFALKAKIWKWNFQSFSKME